MKRRVIVVVTVAAVLAVSMFAVGVTAKETVTRTMQSSPPMMMDGGTQGRVQRCMAMMQKAGVKPEMMRQCRVIMQTPVFVDSPCALYGQADALKLSERQKEQLMSIENEARKKALAVLSDEQRLKVGNISEKPMTMVQMCSKMMPMMQKTMKGQGKAGSMMCPMKQMMGSNGQKSSMCQMKKTPSKSPEQTTCPVTGDPLVNKNIYTEYKGRKVYFCCPKCKGKFEANPEKYSGEIK